MSNQAYSVVLRLVITIVMAFGLLVSPVSISLSHNPIAMAAAEAARHAELAMQIADHGHSHDDGEAAEQSPGHSHGHNAADHSHDMPSTPPGVAPMMQRAARSWQAMLPHLADPNIKMPLDRPPKPIFSA